MRISNIEYDGVGGGAAAQVRGELSTAVEDRGGR